MTTTPEQPETTTPADADTKQSEAAGVVRAKDGKFDKGSVPPAGFNANPQNRGSGSWSKDTSISYWYNYLIRMDETELDDWETNESGEKRTMAAKIALSRVKAAQEEDRLGLDNTREITDRTEGKAPQVVTQNIRRSPLDDLELTPEQLMAIAFAPLAGDTNVPTNAEENAPDDIQEAAATPASA